MSALPPELWDLILELIPIKVLPLSRLISKFYDEIIHNNKRLRYQILCSRYSIEEHYPARLLELACQDEAQMKDLSLIGGTDVIEFIKCISENFPDITHGNPANPSSGGILEICLSGNLYMVEKIFSIYGTGNINMAYILIALWLRKKKEIALWLAESFEFSMIDIFRLTMFSALNDCDEVEDIALKLLHLLILKAKETPGLNIAQSFTDEISGTYWASLPGLSWGFQITKVMEWSNLQTHGWKPNDFFREEDHCGWWMLFWLSLSDNPDAGAKLQKTMAKIQQVLEENNLLFTE